MVHGLLNKFVLFALWLSKTIDKLCFKTTFNIVFGQEICFTLSLPVYGYGFLIFILHPISFTCFMILINQELRYLKTLNMFTLPKSTQCLGFIFGLRFVCLPSFFYRFLYLMLWLELWLWLYSRSKLLVFTLCVTLESFSNPLGPQFFLPFRSSFMVFFISSLVYEL